ncbi:MAG: hypothetical protein ACJ8DX_14600 [Xanthobacteraceae bacterium]|jgi:hypothetical protein
MLTIRPLFRRISQRLLRNWNAEFKGSDLTALSVTNRRIAMWKLMLAGVLTLAAMRSTPAVAGNELVVTDGRIVEFKAMLKLSADQEQYWVPVEATLRDIARRRNVAATTLDDKSLKRLLASAMPLLRRLDPEQKRDLMALARSLGIFSLAIAF